MVSCLYLIYEVVLECIMLVISHRYYRPHLFFQNSENSSSARYLIITNNVGNLYDQERLTTKRYTYCSRDNCDFIIENKSHTLESHGAWMKLYQYLDYQKNYSFIWFLDADAWILKSNVSIAKVSEIYKNTCVISTYLPIQRQLSTGSFIVKQGCENIIEDTLKYRNSTVSPRLYEQFALNQVFKNRGGVGFQAIQHGLIESFYFTVVKGDLVLHVPAFATETKKQVLRNTVDFLGLVIL